MTKEQIRNLAMGIIALAIIVGGIFYYQKHKSPITPDINTIEETTENTDQEKVSNPNTTEDSSQESENIEENKTKFNTAMKNAVTAFNKGDYDSAIKYYKEALSYQDVDTAYSGLFNVYGAQGDWVSAQKALDSAIKLNPQFVDYLESKLTVADEKTEATFQDLKKIYEDGLAKVDPKTKINLVTFFARMAENNNENTEAASLWGYAIEMYPTNKTIYQQEIDRIKSK